MLSCRTVSKWVPYQKAKNDDVQRRINKYKINNAIGFLMTAFVEKQYVLFKGSLRRKPTHMLNSGIRRQPHNHFV